MKEIREDIQILAPANVVWSILMDFEKYPEWNPFILSISGKKEKGAKLKVKLQPPGQRGMTFRPTVIELETGKHFAWLGKVLFHGLFDGEHHFKLIEKDEHTTLFRHYEYFSGILVTPLMKNLMGPTREGFAAMNLALKQRAEQIK